MELIIISDSFNNQNDIDKYKETMKEINAEEQYYVKITKERYRYKHTITFDKDLKISELIKIKDILYGEPIVAVHINNELQQWITLFNKNRGD